MPPYFFRTNPDQAERILANSPKGAARAYELFESQDWARGAMGDAVDKEPTPISRASIDFLANEVVEAAVEGGTLMHVDADSREALQELAEKAGVDIKPLN
jgi:hypothetical protein